MFLVFQLSPINYLGMIWSVPGDFREEVGEPVVKDSGVGLNLPPVWQRHILTLLVDPCSYCTEVQAALCFEVCHKGGNKRRGAKGSAQVRLNGVGRLVWCYAIKVPVMNSLPQCLRRYGWVTWVLAEA